jgi:hypothetical protein
MSEILRCIRPRRATSHRERFVPRGAQCVRRPQIGSGYAKVAFRKGVFRLLSLRQTSFCAVTRLCRNSIFDGLFRGSLEYSRTRALAAMVGTTGTCRGGALLGCSRSGEHWMPSRFASREAPAAISEYINQSGRSGERNQLLPESGWIADQLSTMGWTSSRLRILHKPTRASPCCLFAEFQ